jgi:hypothetical protein
MSILSAINSFSLKRLESTTLVEGRRLIEACSNYGVDQPDGRPNIATIESVISSIRSGPSLISRRELRLAISAIGLHPGLSHENVIALLQEAARYCLAIASALIEYVQIPIAPACLSSEARHPIQRASLRHPCFSSPEEGTLIVKRSRHLGMIKT